MWRANDASASSNVDIVEIVSQIVCLLFHIRRMSRVVLVSPSMICKVYVRPSCHLGSHGGQIMSWRTYDVLLEDMSCHNGGQDISHGGQIMSWRTYLSLCVMFKDMSFCVNSCVIVKGTPQLNSQELDWAASILLSFPLIAWYQWWFHWKI